MKNLTSNQNKDSSTTIIAKSGVVEEKKMVLFEGEIISTNKDNNKNEIIKFEQLNIDLTNLQTSTIKQPKLQETSTVQLFKCMNASSTEFTITCKKNTKKEIITVLNRRIVLPLYIPIISLLCSFLIIKAKTSKNLFLNKYFIFALSFFVLLYAELIIRYTGISKIIGTLFVATPLTLIPLIYFFLSIKLSRESL